MYYGYGIGGVLVLILVILLLTGRLSRRDSEGSHYPS